MCQRCSWKKCWDVIFAKIVFKGKILFLIFCLFLNPRIFLLCLFSFGPGFPRLVPIYPELEIIRHLCFWSPDRVTVPFWATKHGSVPCGWLSGQHSFWVLFLPTPPLCCTAFVATVCLFCVPTKGDIQGVPKFSKERLETSFHSRNY